MSVANAEFPKMYPLRHWHIGGPHKLKIKSGIWSSKTFLILERLCVFQLLGSERGERSACVPRSPALAGRRRLQFRSVQQHHAALEAVDARPREETRIHLRIKQMGRRRIGKISKIETQKYFIGSHEAKILSHPSLY